MCKYCFIIFFIYYIFNKLVLFERVICEIIKCYRSRGFDCVLGDDVLASGYRGFLVEGIRFRIRGYVLLFISFVVLKKVFDRRLFFVFILFYEIFGMKNELIYEKSVFFFCYIGLFLKIKIVNLLKIII